MGTAQRALVGAAMISMAWLAGCSQEKGAAAAAPSGASSEAKQGTTKEAITLRGISFDEGDVRQQITEMCISDATRGGRKEADVKKEGYWCTFDREHSMRLPRFQYGNLGASFGSSSGVLVAEDGVLLRFTTSALKGEILALAIALEEKYGKPIVAESEVRNGLGTKFDKKTFVWVDARGTMITVESMYDRVDEGRVSIEARSYQTAQAMREKLRREVYKSKL